MVEMASQDCGGAAGMCSDDEDLLVHDKEPLGDGDDEEEDAGADWGSGNNADSSNFLSLFAANTGGHLGVARYDEEACAFEVLQLPFDQDCQGLNMLFQQV